MTTLPPPLSGPPPPEIPLPDAPLIRVLAQVKFDTILSIHKPDIIASFQEAIRSDYPLLRQDRVRHIIMPQSGFPEFQEIPIWRFLSRDQHWRVSLGVDFLTLETESYRSREDFVARFRAIISGAEPAFNPQQAHRLGLRYIDRLTGEPLKHINEFIRPKLLGVALDDIGNDAVHIVTEAQLPTEEGVLQTRWGKLPKDATFDEDAIESINEPSWILDLDLSNGVPQPFSSDSLSENLTRFSERIYAVFRWIVTDQFICFYGGKL